MVLALVPLLSWCGPRWVAAVVVVAVIAATVWDGWSGKEEGKQLWDYGGNRLIGPVSAATPEQRVHERRQQSVDSGSGLFIRLVLPLRCTTNDNAAKAAIHKTLTWQKTMPMARSSHCNWLAASRPVPCSLLANMLAWPEGLTKPAYEYRNYILHHTFSIDPCLTSSNSHTAGSLFASICDALFGRSSPFGRLHAKRLYHHHSRRTITYCDARSFKEKQLMTRPGPQHWLVQQGQVTLPQSASNRTSVVLWLLLLLLLLLWMSWQNGTVPCNRLPSSLVLFNDLVKDRSDAGIVPVNRLFHNNKRARLVKWPIVEGMVPLN